MPDLHAGTIRWRQSVPKRRLTAEEIATYRNDGVVLIRGAASPDLVGEMTEAVEQALRARFLPELLNRIDEKIVFQPLTKADIRKIVDLQLEHLIDRVAESNWSLNVADKARDAIADEGFDPVYGARPLKRVIQSRIVNPLATEMLKSDSGEQNSITVDHDGENYFFSVG